MLEIKEYDDIIAMTPEERIEVWGTLDSQALYRAYEDSKKRKLDELDFLRVIFPGDVLEIADAMRSHGIKRFTISSSQDGLQNVLAEFCGLGYRITGMVSINSGIRKYLNGRNSSEPVMFDAIELTIE